MRMLSRQSSVKRLPFRDMKMTLRRGSFWLSSGEHSFSGFFPGLSRMSERASRLALGAYGAASRAAGRAAGGAAGRAATAGRAAGAAVATAVALAVVAVVALTGVLAILVALAVGFRDEIVEPASERPASSLAAAAVTAGSHAKAEVVKSEKPRTEMLSIRFSFMVLPRVADRISICKILHIPLSG